MFPPSRRRRTNRPSRPTSGSRRSRRRPTRATRRRRRSRSPRTSGSRRPPRYLAPDGLAVAGCLSKSAVASRCSRFLLSCAALRDALRLQGERPQSASLGCARQRVLQAFLRVGHQAFARLSRPPRRAPRSRPRGSRLGPPAAPGPHQWPPALASARARHAAAAAAAVAAAQAKAWAPAEAPPSRTGNPPRSPHQGSAPSHVSNTRCGVTDTFGGTALRQPAPHREGVGSVDPHDLFDLPLGPAPETPPGRALLWPPAAAAPSPAPAVKFFRSFSPRPPPGGELSPWPSRGPGVYAGPSLPRAQPCGGKLRSCAPGDGAGPSALVLGSGPPGVLAGSGFSQNGSSQTGDGRTTRAHLLFNASQLQCCSISSRR